jgi:hypothetical protein
MIWYNGPITIQVFFSGKIVKVGCNILMNYFATGGTDGREFESWPNPLPGRGDIDIFYCSIR